MMPDTQTSSTPAATNAKRMRRATCSRSVTASRPAEAPQRPLVCLPMTSKLRAAARSAPLNAADAPRATHRVHPDQRQPRQVRRAPDAAARGFHPRVYHSGYLDVRRTKYCKTAVAGDFQGAGSNVPRGGDRSGGWQRLRVHRPRWREAGSTPRAAALVRGHMTPRSPFDTASSPRRPADDARGRIRELHEELVALERELALSHERSWHTWSARIDRALRQAKDWARRDERRLRTVPARSPGRLQATLRALLRVVSRPRPSDTGPRGAAMFGDSAVAHRFLDGLVGIEVGGSAHNPFHIAPCDVEGVVRGTPDLDADEAIKKAVRDGAVPEHGGSPRPRVARPGPGHDPQ